MPFSSCPQCRVLYLMSPPMSCPLSHDLYTKCREFNYECPASRNHITYTHGVVHIVYTELAVGRLLFVYICNVVLNNLHTMRIN